MLNVSPFAKCFLTTNSNKVRTLSIRIFSEPLGLRKYSTRGYNKAHNKLQSRMLSSYCSQNTFLSPRDKAGFFLFGLQIRNNVKIYADGLSSKRGKNKVFFHVTLTDKNFLKNTLAVFLLYCYILYRYSTSSSHRIVCPYVKFQNSSQIFSFKKLVELSIAKRT